MRKQKATGQKTPTKIDRLLNSLLMYDIIRNKFNEFIHKNNREPNHILLHYINKPYIYDYCNQYYTASADGKINNVYGMKIIWTYDILEDEIICLFG